MKALLDTHAFLWWITDDLRLSSTARQLITDRHTVLFFSAASGWEISIKASLGRIEFPGSPEQFLVEQLRTNRVDALPILLPHALHTSALPPHHRDPFDRMLVAQAQLESLPIISVDRELHAYDVEVLW